MKFFAVIILLTSLNAWSTTPQLDFLAQAESVSQVLARNEDSSAKSWSMSLIRIRTRLEAGIEVPLITKFKLKPEIELHFVKQ